MRIDLERSQPDNADKEQYLQPLHLTMCQQKSIYSGTFTQYMFLLFFLQTPVQPDDKVRFASANLQLMMKSYGNTSIFRHGMKRSNSRKKKPHKYLTHTILR